MPRFTYTGDDGRYYSSLGVTAMNGEGYDLAGEAPDDGRWSPAAPPAPPKPRKPRAPKPAEPVEPPAEPVVTDAAPAADVAINAEGQ